MAEQPITAGGMISEFANPIESLKTQYASLWAIPTYWAMKNSGTFRWMPFYWLGLGSNSIPFKQMGTAALWTKPKNWLRMVLGGFEYNPMAEFVETATQGLSQETKKGLLKSLSSVIKKTDIKKITGKEILEVTGTRVSGAVKQFGMSSKLESVAKAFATKSKFIMNIGRIGNLALLGIAAGQLTSHVIGMAFKGSVASLTYMNAKMKSIRDLELGGDLGIGYRMSAAATERQRAISELRRTGLPGRPGMGNEASEYAGLT